MNKRTFNDYTEEELVKVFEKEKDVQDDIMGLMGLTYISVEIDRESALQYFINECEMGVYMNSYYDETGKITI